ncbi:transposable element Tcb2 transposase [Trichonephila clavipes]|nr:transposable element Tcb2 transposase [Trichonephila clavipes]
MKQWTLLGYYRGCIQGTVCVCVQAGEGSVMVWDVCSWRDMGSLICLDSTLASDKYVSLLSDHLHPFMSIVHSDGHEELQQDNVTPTRPELLQRGSGAFF